MSAAVNHETTERPLHAVPDEDGFGETSTYLMSSDTGEFPAITPVTEITSEIVRFETIQDKLEPSIAALEGLKARVEDQIAGLRKTVEVKDQIAAQAQSMLGALNKIRQGQNETNVLITNQLKVVKDRKSDVNEIDEAIKGIDSELEDLHTEFQVSQAEAFLVRTRKMNNPDAEPESGTKTPKEVEADIVSKNNEREEAQQHHQRAQALLDQAISKYEELTKSKAAQAEDYRARGQQLVSDLIKTIDAFDGTLEKAKTDFIEYFVEECSRVIDENRPNIGDSGEPDQESGEKTPYSYTSATEDADETLDQGDSDWDAEPYDPSSPTAIPSFKGMRGVSRFMERFGTNA